MISKRRIGPNLVAAAVVACASSAMAADWSQFRGPSGDGTTEAANLPVQWGKDKGMRWKAPLPGRGLSCPVVAGDRVYVTACTGPEDRRLHVLAFDIKTGKQLWQRSLAATGSTMCHPKTSMAAPTPVTDGKNVYALFASGDLAAYNRDGHLLWYRSLVGDYPTITNQVGMAASPVWAGNTLVIPMDNDGESFLAGIDPVSGRNRWKVDRPKDINWVSPIVRQLQGQAEVLFQNKSEITAYDAETGKVRWSYTGTGLSTIPSPAIDGDRVLVPAGELISIKPGTGTPEVVWKSTRLAPRGYPSPLVYQGRIYSINSAGVLVCAKAGDGTVLWQERLKSGGPFAASPVAADGKIYVVNEKGICSVVRAGDKPEVLASNDLGDEVLATPALVNGAIFLRTDKHLYCIGSSN